jgi:hypothetical protein
MPPPSSKRWPHHHRKSCLREVSSFLRSPMPCTCRNSSKGAGSWPRDAGLNTVSPLRQRMMGDMNARKLGAHSQRGHISRCKRSRSASHLMHCHRILSPYSRNSVIVSPFGCPSSIPCCAGWSYRAYNVQNLRPCAEGVKTKASVFLATADDIRYPAAQWSLALRRIAMIESKMGAELKGGG